MCETQQENVMEACTIPVPDFMININLMVLVLGITGPNWLPNDLYC
jgi:hypothetical protein